MPAATTKPTTSAQKHKQNEEIPSLLAVAERVLEDVQETYNVDKQPSTPFKPKPKVDINSVYENYLSLFDVLCVYCAYAVLLIFGYFAEYRDKIGVKLGIKQPSIPSKRGYAPLFKELELFWLRKMYQRIRDLFERPIASAPTAWVDVMLRKSDDGNASFSFIGKNKRCLNLASYNYLGFAGNTGDVTDEVVTSIEKYSYATASPRMEAGNLDVTEELEATIARFVGKPAAIVFAMGYATNSTTIPALAGCGKSAKGTLIISDSLNHASIVCGSRDSGAKIIVFKHNNPEDLETVLRESIVEGQPRTHRPWKRIIIIVEGVYSMEGEIARLPEIVALKKKYKAYLYVDEAHSIGALGKNGRGVCEHWGVNPDDIDVLMGTFTKAFGSVGGYVAASKEMIDYLRHTSYGSVYSTAMSPPCAQQALSALRVIMGEEGTNDGQKRLQQLHENSNYFRHRLTEMGFHVIGDDDSPIVPIMVYHPAKMAGLSRALLERGITIVVVGFPVTPLLLSRVRFCISAAHSREDLDWALQQIDELGERCCLKYGTS